MPLVYPEIHNNLTAAKPRLLICDSTGASGSVLESVHAQGYEISRLNILRPMSTEGRALLSAVDIVLFDISTSSQEFVQQTVCRLSSVIGICNLRPRFLCVSTVHRNPRVVLGIEKCGARFARVANPAMLLESVDLAIAELNELQHSGPCFHIVHRFSRGNCAPGEEISAVLLEEAGKFFQLPLGLAQRFIFDLLAQRQMAIDSLQIISGLNDWFFREHAANSGHRQTKKIRRATIKVLIQRTREAMGVTFTEARLRFDPNDVLHSCLAEGSKRVLYKLCADVRWQHINVGC